MTNADRSMQSTRHDLPESVRRDMVALLDARLADSVDLATQVKQAHWQVQGPNFIALHELFDEMHAEALGWSDLLAERAMALGGLVRGTAREAAARSELREYPADARSGADHVEALATRFAMFGALIRAAIATAEGASDAGTADLFTEIVRGSDQRLWFLEAHLR